jgi:hypothetical protein
MGNKRQQRSGLLVGKGWRHKAVFERHSGGDSSDNTRKFLVMRDAVAALTPRRFARVPEMRSGVRQER